VTFFKPLREEELEKVAAGLRYAPFAAGETITRQGAVAHWLYLITDGSAEVRLHVEGCPDRVVATLKAPDFCGEMGLMTGEPRTATVVATSDVECYRLDKETFHKILEDRPEIAEEISGLLAERRIKIAAAIHDTEEGDPADRLSREQDRLLGTIRGFFGLGDSQMR
jgi:CRP-like cAMP-binding protein